MQEEHSRQFPQLICSSHPNQPIILVALNKSDVHSSSLLCSRCVASDVDGLKGKSRDNLVVIEDFLSDLTKKSPLAYTSHQKSAVVKQSYSENLKQFDQRLSSQLSKYKQLGQGLNTGFVETCNQLVHQLSNQAQAQKSNIQGANSHFQNTLQSDPESDASIPKPTEILRRIGELRQSEQLPDYLFSLYSKLQSWQHDSPANLLDWTNRREEYYRNQLSDELLYNFHNQLEDVAVQFWNQSIKRLGEQVIQIIQDDPSLKERVYLDLTLNTPQSLALVTNSMITEHSRVVYTIDKDVSADDGKQIGAALQSLTNLSVLQIDIHLAGGKAPGLSHVAHSIQNLNQLRVLQFRIHDVAVSASVTKEFFGEFKKADLSNLQELSFDVVNSNFHKESVQHITRAIKSIGNDRVQRLILDFRQNQLGDDFGVALGDALTSYKSLNNLVINVSGYSLRQNELKDKGVEAIVKHIGAFGGSLVSLTLNFGYNNLTDASVVGLQRAFEGAQWPKLKHLNIFFNRNKVTERGVRKLAKLVQRLPIILYVKFNLNSTQVTLDGLKQLFVALPSQTYQVEILARQCGLNRQEVAAFIAENSLQNKLLV